MKKKQSFYYFYGKKNLLKIMRLLFILKRRMLFLSNILVGKPVTRDSMILSLFKIFLFAVKNSEYPPSSLDSEAE